MDELSHRSDCGSIDTFLSIDMDSPQRWALNWLTSLHHIYYIIIKLFFLLHQNHYHVKFDASHIGFIN